MLLPISNIVLMKILFLINSILNHREGRWTK